MEWSKFNAGKSIYTIFGMEIFKAWRREIRKSYPLPVVSSFKHLFLKIMQYYGNLAQYTRSKESKV
jgi:hypothetical protein